MSRLGRGCTARRSGACACSGFAAAARQAAAFSESAWTSTRWRGGALFAGCVHVHCKCPHECTYRPGSCVVDPPHMCVPTHSCLPFDTLCRRCPRSPACCCPVTLPAPCVSGPISAPLFGPESAFPLALWTAAAVAARPAVGGLVGRRVCSSQQAACFGNLVASSCGHPPRQVANARIPTLNHPAHMALTVQSRPPTPRLTSGSPPSSPRPRPSPLTSAPCW